MRTPVSISHRALPNPTILANLTVPPSVNGTPHRRLSAPNSALADAILKSHQAASSRPPAKQYPLTAAIVGFSGSRRANPIGPARVAKGWSARLHTFLRSAPEQNASRPAPVTTRTRQLSVRRNDS